ncbi:MAG: 2OG-Fe(II) oxygenase [Alphaproteobacteria bacterium]
MVRAAVADAVALAERLEGRTPAATLQMSPPVLVIPQLFEPDFCRRLIAYWNDHDKLADMVSTGDFRGGGQIAEASLKRRLDTPITDVELTRAIAERMQRRAGPMIGKAFKTVANHFETFKIGCYDAANAGGFGRHWDDTAPKAAHRKLAMSVNLNTGEYEGGELVFPEFGRIRYAPPSGTAVVFSCSLLHEALPVTRGRRFGLFGFFFDDQGAAQVRQWIEADGGRIQVEQAR